MLRLLPLLIFGTVLFTGCAEKPVGTEKTELKQEATQSLQAGALKIGDKLPDFTLETLEGESVQLSKLFDGDTIVAVIWHSPACPCAANCLTAVREQLTADKYKRLKILGVASDSQQDSEWFTEDLKQQSDSGILIFPVVFDKDQSVQKAYGAKRTPTVYLADETGTLQFWGAPESTLYPGTEGHQTYIVEAVDALLAKKTPETQTFPPIGCLIE